MGKLNWAILGTGAIATTFAKGLRLSGNGELVAVGSRSLASAEEFCLHHGGKAFGSYEEALTDRQVDAVYIALPHHMHAEYTILSAQAGKHILCEKPFTLNLSEAERALEVVRARGVLFMEAWMYRSHPQTLKVKRLIEDGAIGAVRAAHAEFGYRAARDWNHFKADGAVGGGGLLDVGAYPVSFLRMVAGREPTRAEYSCEITDRGADAIGAGLLEFGDDFRATFGCAIHLEMANTATIYGEEGQIYLPSPWFCHGPILMKRGGETTEVEFETVPDLWAHQAKIVADCLPSVESPTMPWNDTLGNMKTLDDLRQSAGLVFGAEVKP